MERFRVAFSFDVRCAFLADTFMILQHFRQTRIEWIEAEQVVGLDIRKQRVRIA